MISKLLNNRDELFSSLEPSHYARRIKSHYYAYSVGYDFSSFFAVQREGVTVGVISLFNSSMIVGAVQGYTFNDDEIEELAIFIRMNLPHSVELDPIFSSRLYPLVKELYSVDLRTQFAYRGKPQTSDLQVDEVPRLDDVFEILSESFPDLEKSYELWLTDTSHRVRHGLSQSFLSDGCTTATIQYIIDGTAVIGQVATKPEFRGRHHARRLLYWIGGRLTADGYDVRLFARPHRVSYYEEIGFAAISHDNVLELNEREKS